MGLYTYQIVNSLNGAPIDEVDITGVSYSTGLQGRGQFTGTVSVDDPKATPALLQTLSREIVVLRGGQPVWCGPIIGLEPSISSRTVTVTAAPLFWWLTRRTLELQLDYSHTPTAIGEVAWALVANAQGKAPAGDLRLLRSPSYPQTSQTVTNVYLSSDRRWISDLLTDLSDQAPGFDFMFELTMQPSGIVRRDWKVWAPLKGINLDISIGDDDLIDGGYTEDGSAATSRIHELGSGTGDTQYIISANVSGAGSMYPMVEEVESRDSSDLTTLTLYAQADLFLHRWPARAYSTTHLPSEKLPYGSITPGDYVYFDVALGNFPLTGLRRATDVSVSVGDAEDETVQITWNEVG